MEYTLGAVICADGDFVRYSSRCTVTKGMCAAYDESEEYYTNQIKFQTMLSEHGMAPRLIQKDIEFQKDNQPYWLIVSEDAGLPISEDDVPAVNTYLDVLYDMGIILHWFIDKQMFVKGFDGKIRTTDFRMTEMYEESIGKHNRKYLQWKV